MFSLNSEICTLKAFTKKEQDSVEYYRWLCDYEVIKTLNLPSYLRPVSREIVDDYVENLLKSSTDIFLAIYAREDSNTFVGTLKIGTINPLCRTADIGIMIGDRKFWGKGLGTNAISLAVDYCFERLGLRKVTAGAMAVNPGAVKCFEKVGFLQEGCFRQQDFFEGRFVDHIYLGCLVKEFVKHH